MTEASPTTSLSSLSPGQRARVVDVHGGPTYRLRLMELGFVPGTPVSCVGRSPMGDPVRYRIRGAVLGLRRSEAHHVLVTVEGP